MFLQWNVAQILIANGSYRALESYESEEFMPSSMYWLLSTLDLTSTAVFFCKYPYLILPPLVNK